MLTEAETLIDDASVTVSGLTKWFGDRTLFADVTTTIRPGLTAVLGPSGSGKTTFLLVVAGIEAPSAGRVDLPARPAFTGRCSWIMQSANLLPARTACDNVALSLIASGARSAHAKQQAMLALATVGLAPIAHRQAGGLSGGERQRVAVARALVAPARLVLADEPTASLGLDHRTLIIDALQALGASGRVVLVATHDPVVAEACDRVLHLGRHDAS